MSLRRRAAAHPDQLRFDLGDGAAQPARPPSDGDSVFFAIQPDPDTATRAEELARAQQCRHGLAGKLRPARVLHVSLVALGNYEALSRDAIAAACKAASTVQVSRFVVALDHLRNFNNAEGYAVVLAGDDGVVGLMALYDALDAAMKAVWPKRKGRSDIKPHMTLLYSPRMVPEVILDEPVTWTAREFVLVRSRNGQTRYERLGCWPLRG